MTVRLYKNASKEMTSLNKPLHKGVSRLFTEEREKKSQGHLVSPKFQYENKISGDSAQEVALWFRALVTLVEDPGSVLSSCTR